MKVLLLVADLISRQQIKSAITQPTVYIRSLDQLRQEIVEASPIKLVIDLANQQFEITELVTLLKEHSLIDQTIAFFPHLLVDLAKEAQAAGIPQLYPRSKFFSNIPQVLGV